MIVAGTIFFIWRLGIRKESRDLAWLGLVLGAAIMPFIASRYLAFWSVFTAAPFAWTLSGVAKPLAARFSSSAKRVVFAFICIVGIGLIIYRWIVLPRTYVDPTILPVYAAEFLATNGAQGNVFNTYSEGGYLLWRLWPNIKIAMDGRSEVYLGQPIADYYAILENTSSTDFLINQKYNIQYFVLPYEPDFFTSIASLITYLEGNHWQLVWWDDGAIIFARDDAQNQNMISQYALHYVSPFVDPATISQQNAPAAGRELGQLMERSPASGIVASYADDFLQSHRGNVLP
jgi:hypothetical protein